MIASSQAQQQVIHTANGQQIIVQNMQQGQGQVQIQGQDLGSQQIQVLPVSQVSHNNSPEHKYHSQASQSCDQS